MYLRSPGFVFLRSNLRKLDREDVASYIQQMKGSAGLSALPIVLVPPPHIRVERKTLSGSPYVVGTRILVRRLYALYNALYSLYNDLYALYNALYILTHPDTSLYFISENFVLNPLGLNPLGLNPHELNPL